MPRDYPRRWRAAEAATVVVVFLVLGAAVGFWIDRPPAGPAPAPPVERAALVGRTELTAAATSTDRDRVLQAAELVLIADCMRASGFEYPLESGALDGPAAGSGNTGTIWPDDDVEAAERDGFPDPPAGADPGSSALSRYVSSLSPARQRKFTLALYGDRTKDPKVEVELPSGVLSQSRRGCSASAQQTLFGDLDGYLRGRLTADNLSVLVSARVAEDPELVAAESAWRQCVTEGGWPASGLEDLRAQLAQKTTGSAAERSRLDRDVATLSARCSRSARLAATGKRVTAAKTEQVRTELHDVLADLDARQSRALEPARRVLAEHP
jgi:hypothetical protein